MTEPLFERKHVPCFAVKAKSIKEKDRTLEAVVSSDIVDRDGEIVVPKAFEKRLDTFKANPVLLWNHNPFEPPIGKVVDLEISEKRIDAKMQFRPEGDSELADDVFKAFAGGFLSSFSIGFRVFEVEQSKDVATGRPNPVRITDGELFEISAVTIPANTDALVKADRMLRRLKGAGFQAGDEQIRTVYAAPTDLDVLKRCRAIAKRIQDRVALRDQVNADELAALEELRLAVMCATAKDNGAADIKAVQELLSCLTGSQS